MSLLKITDFTVIEDSKLTLVCKRLNIKGMCGVVNATNNKDLKRYFETLFSTSLLRYDDSIKWALTIELNKRKMNFGFFNRLLNPHHTFKSGDTIESVLCSINKALAESVIRDFNLSNIRTAYIRQINCAESYRFETAVSVCSQSPVVYINENLDQSRTTIYYLQKIKKYLDTTKCIVLIDTDVLHRKLFDSYVLIDNNEITSFVCQHHTSEETKYIRSLIYSKKCARKQYRDPIYISEPERKRLATRLYKKGGKYTNILFRQLTSFHRLYGFIRIMFPNISHAVSLTNTRLRKYDEMRCAMFYYQLVGNVTMLFFVWKHYRSLFCLFLLFANCFLVADFSNLNRLGLFSAVIISFVKWKLIEIKRAKDVFRKKYLPNFVKIKLPEKKNSCNIENFCSTVINILLESCIGMTVYKLVVYNSMNVLIGSLRLFVKEYAYEAPVCIEKVLTSSVYVYMFYKVSTVTEFEYRSTRKNLSVLYSPATLYVHLLLYAMCTCGLSVIIFSLVINMEKIFISALHAASFLPMLNYLNRGRKKYFFIVIFIGLDIIYSIWTPRLYRNSRMYAHVHDYLHMHHHYVKGAIIQRKAYIAVSKVFLLSYMVFNVLMVIF